MENQENDVSLKSLFEKYDNRRSSLLTRARKCAELTIPALLPENGHAETDPLPTPYQGFGARGVNNLSSKLLLALLPTNSPFFRFDIDGATMEKLVESMGEKNFKTNVQARLARLESSIQQFLESQASRVPVFQALKLLVATGNACTFLPDEGGMRVYRLDQYVVKRDPAGHVIDLITKEKVHPAAIEDEDTRAKIVAKTSEEADKDNVELYTRVKLTEDGKQWEVLQEVAGEAIPGSEGTYPLKECPWIVLRWTAIQGEDYGRGHVEEYIGDLISLEGLMKSIVEGTAVAAKVIFMVNPNGTTNVNDLKKAQNTGFVSGSPDDVHCLQVEKQADFQMALNTVVRIEERLAQAFLLHSSIQRDAERVTAEEIRFMASELEDALGGIYSILSQEFQRPLLNRVMGQMRKTGKLPALPEGVVQLTITTGLEALGRGHDLNKLITFVKSIKDLGEQSVMPYLNMGNLIQRISTALGVDPEGLIRPEEEVQQAQQSQQQQAMAQQLAPNAVKGMMDMGKAQMEQQAQPQQ